jgi:hypothetical protein
MKAICILQINQYIIRKGKFRILDTTIEPFLVLCMTSSLNPTEIISYTKSMAEAVVLICVYETMIILARTASISNISPVCLQASPMLLS